MNAKQSKVSKATQAAIRGGNFYDDGVSLGQDLAVSSDAIVEALATCKKPADKSALLAGFIAGYVAASKKKITEGAARRTFYRLAKKYAPESSNRQSKANKKKADEKAANDEKAAKIQTIMSEKEMAQAIMSATMFIAEWQVSAGGGTLEKLGALLQILTPSTAAKKAKAAKAKAAPVDESDDDESDDDESDDE
jgi:hypothetical protein